MKDFLDVFWRAFLIFAGLIAFVFLVPYLGFCLFGNIGGMIGIGIMLCTLFAAVVAGLVTFK